MKGEYVETIGLSSMFKLIHRVEVLTRIDPLSTFEILFIIRGKSRTKEYRWMGVGIMRD